MNALTLDFAPLVQNQHYPASALFVVATPIGNLADMSFRALWTLRHCRVLACEDTRTTRHLLRQYGFDPSQFQFLSLHLHNEAEALEQVLGHLAKGERVALLSDAGTPAVSDPGSQLVAAVATAGYAVIPLPGASAVISALSICGWESAATCFIGFLPTRAAARREALLRYQQFAGVLIAFEAPHRIQELIVSLHELFPPTTPVVLARELTKQFETIYRHSLADLYAQRASIPERGEFVVLLHLTPPSADLLSASEVVKEKVLQALLAELPVAQAVRLAVAITGERKNALYNRALTISKGQPSEPSPAASV